MLTAVVGLILAVMVASQRASGLKLPWAEILSLLLFIVYCWCS